MSKAQRLDVGKRIENYANQNGSDWERTGEIRLTPKQQKRTSRKVPRAINSNLSTAQFG